MEEMFASFLSRYPLFCVEAQEYLSEHIYALDLQQWVDDKCDGPEW